MELFAFAIGLLTQRRRAAVARMKSLFLNLNSKFKAPRSSARRFEIII